MSSAMRSLAAVMFLAGACCTGCTSVKSTYFHRDDADSSWEKNHIKGVPVTLDIPTHVRITITETVYHDGAKYLYLDANQPLRTRDVKHDFITEKKIFGVDFKRPAAGPFVMNNTYVDQKLNKVEHTLTDNTIEKTGEAINNLVGTLLPKGIGKGKATSSELAGYQPLETLICSRVFKLDAPDLEAQLAMFLEANCCPQSALARAPQQLPYNNPTHAQPMLNDMISPPPSASRASQSGGVLRASATIAVPSTVVRDPSVGR